MQNSEGRRSCRNMTQELTQDEPEDPGQRPMRFAAKDAEAFATALDAASARLFGAAQAIREELDSPIEPFNRDRYDEDVAATRCELGSAEFEAASAEGRREPVSSLLSQLLAPT